MSGVFHELMDTSVMLVSEQRAEGLRAEAAALSQLKRFCVKQRELSLLCKSRISTRTRPAEKVSAALLILHSGIKAQCVCAACVCT